MIIFESKRVKRVKPFAQTIDDVHGVDTSDGNRVRDIEIRSKNQIYGKRKRKPDGDILYSDIEDGPPLKKDPRRYDHCELDVCRSSLEEDKVSNPVDREVSSNYDHSMGDTEHSSRTTELPRFIDDENHELECSVMERSPILLQDNDNGEESSDAQSSMKERSYSHHDVDTANENNLKSVEMKLSDGHRHILSPIPPTQKKRWPQKPCIICRRHGIRHDTRHHCLFCRVALCREPCFREYHSA